MRMHTADLQDECHTSTRSLVCYKAQHSQAMVHPPWQLASCLVHTKCRVLVDLNKAPLVYTNDMMKGDHC